MPIRILAAVLGVFHAANGLYMVIAPEAWFAAGPGVSDTGPFNPHFVRDVGFAFIGAGLALLGFAWKPRLKLLALGASAFIVLHALFHLSNFVHGHMDHAGVDLLIAATAFLGLAICWPRKGDI